MPLNSGNGRMVVFHKDAGYEACERLLNAGTAKYPDSLFAFHVDAESLVHGPSPARRRSTKSPNVPGDDDACRAEPTLIVTPQASDNSIKVDSRAFRCRVTNISVLPVAILNVSHWRRDR